MSTIKFLRRCDYIPSYESARTFADRMTDPARVDEQILHLDNHIYQLNQLRSTLIHRSNQLRSPSYTVPVEVLSRIFQELVAAVLRPFSTPPYYYYKACCAVLRQSFIISSVSMHFRQVALGMPELWERIGFEFVKPPVHKYMPLFEHCATRAYPRFLSLRFRYAFALHKFIPSNEEIRFLENTLFSPHITREVHTLDLGSIPPWLSMPSIPSTFPRLEILTIDVDDVLPLDLRALPLSRLTLRGDRARSILLPPSVQYIDISGAPYRGLLHQCPNLAEGFIGAEILREYFDDNGPPLCRLKRLTCKMPSNPNFTFSSLIGDSRMSSLEYLKITNTFYQNQMVSLILRLSGNAPSTLKVLFLKGLRVDPHATSLFRLPMQNLQDLKIGADTSEDLVSAIRALTLGAKEFDNEEMKYLPRLKFLGLESESGIRDFPAAIIELLKETEIGVAHDFHLALPSNLRGRGDEEWSPELREELNSIVNSRRIKVTWDGIRDRRIVAGQRGSHY
ncbi:hypothetical protein Agabi119p4_5378 [Agaricus bisporus var. burnettii]|uniref:F-box domain-containing protein n=1 Tax=Agaricus bisporus var. burnettii TaxID=192524 RepID=A0A8H7F1K0_AGABI|nr:hypothetical protein Agabi119p4_5378 [Agaricus bisporus var. burnettii]